MLCVTRTPFVALLVTDTAADTFTDLYRFSSLQGDIAWFVHMQHVASCSLVCKGALVLEVR
jgi:hypothetical protein